jgi:hypothetical protein
MKTLKQEIKELKTGYEKIFKVDYEDEYIIIRKSKLKGLEIYFYCGWADETIEISYEEIRNNCTEFSLYDQSKIDY